MFRYDLVLTQIIDNIPFISRPRRREWELLPSVSSPADNISEHGYGRRLSVRPIALRRKSGQRTGRGRRRGQLVSNFGGRRLISTILALGALVLFTFWIWADGRISRGSTGRRKIVGVNGEEILLQDGDDGGRIPFGQSRERNGEVFWWEQFERLSGFWVGRREVVRERDWVCEQDGGLQLDLKKEGRVEASDEVKRRDVAEMRSLDDLVGDQRGKVCYIDEEKKTLPPSLSAYRGIPQGFPAPLFGSSAEIGIETDICYDRINRFSPYGYGFTEEEGGLGIKIEGDNEGLDAINVTDFKDVKWNLAQKKCFEKNDRQSRTAFMIRTWQRFDYTPYHIMMLRAIVSELALASGGRYEVHFLIHVQDDDIPIWASKEIYDRVLAESLPEEFAGMGTLWSVAQMKLIYPPPFPETLVNFSGDDIYKAYRSLHFPLQYFAEQHPEFEYYWHWEMDMRVTGHYLELLDRISEWADRQPKEHSWERNARFFVPGLYKDLEGGNISTHGSYEAYSAAIDAEVAASNISAITGPQLPESSLLTPLPHQPSSSTQENGITDLITFNPLFDPIYTLWAFHEDITGYNISATNPRPPTRAALITASRLSRRLLQTMHKETYTYKHTMFPEMFPASIALHYGYKALSAPLPIYLDRNWTPSHANLIFNNAPIPPDSPEAKDEMGHGKAKGFFYGVGGSVFGPGEHVFRGASWYSNAGFAGYLWRRWLGKETAFGEVLWENGDFKGEDETEEERLKGIGKGSGRMCLPMMVLHPIKFE